MGRLRVNEEAETRGMLRTLKTIRSHLHLMNVMASRTIQCYHFNICKHSLMAKGIAEIRFVVET